MYKAFFFFYTDHILTHTVHLASIRSFNTRLRLNKCAPHSNLVSLKLCCHNIFRSQGVLHWFFFFVSKQEQDQKDAYLYLSMLHKLTSFIVFGIITEKVSHRLMFPTCTLAVLMDQALEQHTVYTIDVVFTTVWRSGKCNNQPCDIIDLCLVRSKTAWKILLGDFVHFKHLNMLCRKFQVINFPHLLNATWS